MPIAKSVVVLFAVSLLAAPVAFRPAFAAGAQAKAEASRSPSAEAVREVALAHAMVRYGDAKADPVALVAAARVLKQLGERPAAFKARPGATTPSKTDGDAFAVAAVLERARTLAGGRSDLRSLIDDVASSNSRGAVEGPGFWAQLALARTVYSYHIDFRGGEFAAVGVTPHQDGDIVLMVYDEAGNLVCKKGDDTGLRLCAWYTRRTQTYTIKVVNRGDVSGYVGYYL